ncbi:MAG TPA: AAA-associated domain-containing protein [Candidatus Bathyarchaeia archaeon]|nr:AAA-associated domain-containing protein [Candidatus Bathyarchaeia archaeon]
MDIPKTHYTVLLGFVEVLDDLGGKSDVAGIASKQGLELDDLLPILESGEMLGLIQVSAGDVSITEKGHLFIVASPKVRKKMLRDVVINLDTFKKLIDLVKQSDEGYISKDEVLEFVSNENLSTQSPDGDVDISDEFNWIVEWGRQVLIFNYDANKETITVRKR